MCGWSWSGLGVSGAVQGSVGLYIGSDFTNIRVAQRDMLGALGTTTDKQSLFKDTFATNNAPTGNSLFAAAGYGEQFEVFTFPGGCIRSPYGRIHTSSLSKMDTYYKYSNNVSLLGDETLHAYCETIKDQAQTGQFMYCDHDPKTYEDRLRWCSEHINANLLVMGFSPGPYETPCFVPPGGTTTCIVYAGDAHFKLLDDVIDVVTDKSNGIVILVAPFSMKVRESLETKRRSFDISQSSVLASWREEFSNPQTDGAFKELTHDFSLTTEQYQLLADPNKWCTDYSSTCSTDSALNLLSLIHSDIQTYPRLDITQSSCSTECWGSTCTLKDGSTGVYLPIPPDTPSGEFEDFTGTESVDMGSCMEAFHFKPTLTSRGSRISTPGVTLRTIQDETIFMPPVQDSDFFGKTRATCTGLIINKPRFVLENALLIDQDGCDKDSTGYSAIGVIISGDTAHGTTIEGVTVKNSKLAAAIGILGGDRDLAARRNTVDISGIEIKNAHSQDGMFDIAMAHASARRKSIKFPESNVRLLFQETQKDDLNMNKASVNYSFVTSNLTATNVTSYTSLFGAPFENKFFHPKVQSHTAIIIAVATLIPLSAVLFLVLMVVYVKDRDIRNNCEKDPPAYEN